MKADRASNLVCPLCAEQLAGTEKQLVCSRGHNFDIARQGYINLLPVQHKRSRHPGDSKAMVVARTQFLDSGVYQPIAERLCDVVSGLIDTSADNNLLDAGCGEGYYFDYLLDKLVSAEGDGSLCFTGIDISKEAIIAAARRNKLITWLVASNRQPPVADESIDLILCMFGFMSVEGFARVLKPDGKLLLVDPGEEHLKELRSVIYRDDKEDEATSAAVEIDGFTELATERLTFTDVTIDQMQIENLLTMTPHIFRASREGKLAASRLQQLDLTVDVVFRVLEKQL